MNSWIKESVDEREKEHLLKVVILPDVPLHCYAAELVAGAKVRKRDVSLQTIIEKGTKANNTFTTIVQTAKKLGVSAYSIYVRESETNLKCHLWFNSPERKAIKLRVKAFNSI